MNPIFPLFVILEKVPKNQGSFNSWLSHTCPKKQGPFNPRPSHTCWFKTSPPPLHLGSQCTIAYCVKKPFIKISPKLAESYLCNKMFNRKNKTCLRNVIPCPFFHIFFKKNLKQDFREELQCKSCVCTTTNFMKNTFFSKLVNEEWRHWAYTWTSFYKEIVICIYFSFLL